MSTRARQEERELHHRRATLNKAILPRACTPRLKASLSSSFLEQASRIFPVQADESSRRLDKNFKTGSFVAKRNLPKEPFLFVRPTPTPQT